MNATASSVDASQAEAPVTERIGFGRARSDAALDISNWEHAAVSMILVHRSNASGREYLVMRAVEAGGQDDLDWAWRPPSGGIEEGESDEDCARRELREETGIHLDVTRVAGCDYPTFAVEVPAGCDIVLSDEHDAFEWVVAAEMLRRCRPSFVSAGIGEALRLLGHV